MATTPTYSLRYPTLGDTPNVPRDIQRLAEDVETVVKAHKTASDSALAGRVLSSTGTAGKRMAHVAFGTAPAGASGFVTYTHGLGWTPAGIFITSTGPSSYFSAPWGVDNITSTTFRVRWFNASAAGSMGTGITCGSFQALFIEA